MKALTVQRDGQYDQTHELPKLASHCTPYDAYFAEKNTIRILEQFDLFDQVGRYGGAANFDPMPKGKEIAGVALNVGSGAQFAGAWVWKSSYLDELDGFVFKARSLLDFSKSIFDDGLKSVLDNNERSSLVASWTGRPTIRTILTRNNRHFRAAEWWWPQN